MPSMDCERNIAYRKDFEVKAPSMDCEVDVSNRTTRVRHIKLLIIGGVNLKSSAPMWLKVKHQGVKYRTDDRPGGSGQCKWDAGFETTFRHLRGFELFVQIFYRLL